MMSEHEREVWRARAILSGRLIRMDQMLPDLDPPRKRPKRKSQWERFAGALYALKDTR